MGLILNVTFVLMSTGGLAQPEWSPCMFALLVLPKLNSRFKLFLISQFPRSLVLFGVTPSVNGEHQRIKNNKIYDSLTIT